MQWMETQSEDIVPKFRNRQGSWRPDFLLEDDGSTEYYRICEINARFAFNGYLHSAFGQLAYMQMDDKVSPLTAPAVIPGEASAIMSHCFRPLNLTLNRSLVACCLLLIGLCRCIY